MDYYESRIFQYNIVGIDYLTLVLLGVKIILQD